MTYKAIVCDIDGTLTPPISRDNMMPLPSTQVVGAIKDIRTKMPFVLATSRPMAYTRYLIELLELQHPCITLSGSLIQQSDTEDILIKHPIPMDVYHEICTYLTNKGYSFIINDLHVTDQPYDSGYTPDDPLIVFAPELSYEQVREIERELSHISTLACHIVPSLTPGLWACNISNSQASKQHAALEVAELLGIDPIEMIGIGDGYNDFPLLMACGFKVAMGNAVDDLKAIADYVAPSVHEDGVAHVIEQYILKR
jgi:hypothetical protein